VAMTTDQQQQQQQAAPPAIADLLSWDEEKQGAPPIQAVPLADLRAYITQRDGELTARVSNDVMSSLRAAREREEANQRQHATVQEDIDWANSLQQRMFSADPAVKAAAESEAQTNQSRYERGLAFKYQSTLDAEQNRVLSQHYAPLMEGLKTAGHQQLIDLLASPEQLAKAGGNPFIAAVDYAEQRGYERGKTEAAEAADLQRRIDEGTRNGQGMHNGGSRRTDSPVTAGIAMGTPGSTRLLRQRLAAK